MGIIRGGLLVIASVVLFILFLAGNTLFTLSLSLDYETIRPELISVVKETLGEKMDFNRVIEERMDEMSLYCQNNSEYVFSDAETGRVFEVSCETVAQGSEAIADKILDDFVHGIYNGQEESVNFNFASLENSITSYFYYSLIAILILFIFVFLLAEAKSNAFILAGSLLVISALPFIKIEQFLKWIPFELAEHFIIFFSQAYSVFLISLIVGLVLLTLGIVMKFFGIGFKISEFFSKFSKEKNNTSQSSKNQISEEPAKKSVSKKSNSL